LGGRGEKLARQFLKRAGLKILAENYRCPAGEADLIALDASTQKTTGAQTIALVEVKTRSGDHYTDPESAVDSRKRRKMRKVAEHYLASRRAGDFNLRFDIVSVVIRPGEGPQVKHIPGAF
jgi:putative endonuclease